MGLYRENEECRLNERVQEEWRRDSVLFHTTQERSLPLRVSKVSPSSLHQLLAMWGRKLNESRTFENIPGNAPTFYEILLRLSFDLGNISGNIPISVKFSIPITWLWWVYLSLTFHGVPSLCTKIQCFVEFFVR